MVRDGDPGPPDDDVDREKMSLWCDYERGKVGIQVGSLKKLLDPSEARAHADEMEVEFDGTDVLEDPETQAFISGLRERADEVEHGRGTDD